MKSASSQQFPVAAASESKPLLVLRAQRGSNGEKSSSATAAPARATQTQLMGSNGQPASVRFRSQTRLEYSNP